jgi:hypothetical protein
MFSLVVKSAMPTKCPDFGVGAKERRGDAETRGRGDKHATERTEVLREPFLSAVPSSKIRRGGFPVTCSLVFDEWWGLTSVARLEIERSAPKPDRSILKMLTLAHAPCRKPDPSRFHFLE